MPRKVGYLDRLQISSPCPADWDRMIGTEQIRFCSECNKNVYNLSRMTRNQAEALVSRSKGQLCARFYRQEDGVILTEDNRAGLHLISRRASPIATAVVSAILSLGGSAAAQTTAGAGQPVPIHSGAESNKKAQEPEAQLATASITGTVFDDQRAVVARATVTLTHAATDSVQTQVSSQEGLYCFASLEPGTYMLTFKRAGFLNYGLTDIILKQGDGLSLDVTMSAGESVTLSGAVGSPVLPLRELYERSDLIVVARVGKSRQAKGKDKDTPITTKLRVSSVVKGDESKSTITVFHHGWGEGKNFPGELKEGDAALIFLDKSDKGKGFEVVDPSYGVKKLVKADLKIYLQRIDELAAITRQEKAPPEEIVEWLVRCAEEPATRWEGASELSWHADSLRESEEEVDNQEPDADGTEAEQPEAEKPDEIAIDEDDEIAETTDASEDKNREPNFAALLTQGQKDRLAAALFNTREITERDLTLIQLVQTWNDARLLPFLVSQLRRMDSKPPYFASELVRITVGLVNDEEVDSLGQLYNDNFSREDEEGDGQAGEGDRQEAAVSAVENRSAMLRRFLALVESKMKP